MKVLDRKKSLGKDNDSSLLFSEIDDSTYPEPVEGMPRSKNGLWVSEEEYWEKYYHDPDFTYEWNNGILEEKPMADYLSFEMYRWFFLLLEEYLKAHPIAKLVGLDIGFRLALPEKTSIRRPDLALLLHSNPIAIEDEDCTYKGIYDLCIEFLSDSTPQEAKRDTVVKKSEYCQAGVQEYFILDRKGKETAFYRLNKRGQYSPIPQPEGVIRSEVLPGFQFRIEDLYRYPDIHEKINDSVYSSFILLDYQALEQRAETAEKRAEKFAAKLRALGIEPESL